MKRHCLYPGDSVASHGSERRSGGLLLLMLGENITGEYQSSLVSTRHGKVQHS